MKTRCPSLQFRLRLISIWRKSMPLLMKWLASLMFGLSFGLSLALLNSFAARKKLQKFGKWESQVFSEARTNVLATALTRRDFIKLKLRISKLSTTLTALKANYDQQSPTAHQDCAVIQQLGNDLFTMVMNATIQECDLATQQSLRPSINHTDQPGEESANSLARMQYPVLLHFLLKSI